MRNIFSSQDFENSDEANIVYSAPGKTENTLSSFILKD
jgi:hypothetical protein